MNNYDFDLGLGSNRPRSLNDQKNQKPSSQQSRPNNTTSSSWQPKPSWTHQPAPTQPVRSGFPGGATSMAGDIFGKSWGSPAPPTTTTKSGIGIVNKNPNLFGDLVSSALGQNKGNSNVPLKNAIPVSNAYSMGNLADSLPKTGNSVKGSGNLGSSESFGTYTSGYNSSSSNSNVKSVKIGGGLGSSKDPFVSLVDFGSKPLGSMNLSGKGNKKSPSGDDAFGDFQNASKSAKPGFTPNPVPTNSSSSMGSNSGSYLKVDDFPIPTPQNQPPVQSSGVDVFDSLFSSSSIPTPQNQPPVQSSGVDVFDSLFSSSSASVGGGPKGSEGLGSQQFAGADDWGMDSEFGGGNETGGTTELEGLPPPPAGVSASAAKNKGMDHYKQGQYPDAIKWLSWAVILHEKAGNDAATMEVLSSRASCYKEVGEYKKAVADCTKVLEHDGKNVVVLVQRALLYESMEKYKLGAEDLKTVMKLDPGNRVARSTIHRLTKMAD